LQQTEADGLEFKSEVPRHSQIAEYVVGIGNAGGGFLICGVTDKVPRQVVGLGNLTLDSVQNIRRSVYDSTNVRVELETVKMDSSVVLAIRIPSRPRGTVFCTRDGKFLIRIGEDLRGLSQSQIAAMLAETGILESLEEVPITLTLPNFQHSQHYSVQLKNDSDLELQAKKIWFEKDGLKLGDVATNDWLAVRPHSTGVIAWRPDRNPVDVLINKWYAQQRKLIPGHTVTEEIDIILSFVVPNGRLYRHRERIMVSVDWSNRMMSQWF
jgi:predicted HTH transcriptional regulator